MQYEAIVIGVSAGGMNAIKTLCTLLPKGFRIPIVILQHVSPRSDSEWVKLLNNKSHLNIKEADEKEKIGSATVYIAPPNYHLLIEEDKTFSFTIDERINFARPSIDVLFETAAEIYKNKLIGIVLTGSNSDGTNGIKRIAECGGLTIIQNPETAESPFMPASALGAIKPDHVLNMEDIIKLLTKIDQETSHEFNNQE